ncbi:MAG: hypothetical protein R3C97_08060 [Geminicoccaceae bacterium]
MHERAQRHAPRLTNYGDEAFSLYLRKAFIKAMAIPTMRSDAR